MINFAIWLIVGAVLGCLATIIIPNRRRDLLINNAVGMAGAFVVGYLVPSLFQKGQINQGIINLPALLVSLFGAITLLAIVNFFRREGDVKDSTVDREWEKVHTKLHTRWGRLTDQDITNIDSHHDQLNIILQERYHISPKEAVDQMQRYMKARLSR